MGHRMFLGVSAIPTRPVTTQFTRQALVGLTGGDEALPENPEFLKFVAKCHAQMVTGRKNWPIFEPRRMGKVLSAHGVDLEAQMKSVDEPLAMPSFFQRPEETVRLLRGLSFLTTDPSSAADHLRQREELVRNL